VPRWELFIYSVTKICLLVSIILMPETATGKRQEEGTGKWRRSFTKQFHVSFYSNSLVSRMK
jgi:hypothetical protein